MTDHHHHYQQQRSYQLNNNNNNSNNNNNNNNDLRQASKQQYNHNNNNSNNSVAMNGYRQTNTPLPPGISQNQQQSYHDGYYMHHHMDGSAAVQMIQRGNSNNSINMNVTHPHGDSLNSRLQQQQQQQQQQHQQQMFMHQRQYQSENDIYFDQQQIHCYKSSGNIQPMNQQQIFSQNPRQQQQQLQQQQQQQQHIRFKQQQPLSSDETIHLQQSPPLIQSNNRGSRISYQLSSYPHLYPHSQQHQLHNESDSPPLQVASTPHIRSQTNINHPSQQVNETNGNNNLIAPPVTRMLIEHLELSEFKIEPCTNPNNHNHKQCRYYHSLKDRRRPCVSANADMCSNSQNCPDGDACTKAHNKVEELYCAEKYKTKFCTFYPNSCHSCDYGNYCSFAHTEDDITIDLIENYPYDEDFYIFHYKTVNCPFNFIKHDKANCVYSHNWQDYRRKPQDFSYEPFPCSNWKPNSYISKYEEGCPNRFECRKCHGWKEMEYHPRNYRTKQCTQTTNHEKCNKGPQCPYYHNAAEKRVLPQSVFEGLFKFRPRNRNIRNTYKHQQGQTPLDSQRQNETSIVSPKLNQMHSAQSLPDSINTQHLINYTQQNSSQQLMQPQQHSHQMQVSQQQLLQQQQQKQLNNNNNSTQQQQQLLMQSQQAIQKPMRLNTSFQLGEQSQKEQQSQSYDENSLLNIKCNLDFEDTSVDEDAAELDSRKQSVFSVFGEPKQQDQVGIESIFASIPPLSSNNNNGKTDLEELQEECDEMEDSVHNKFSLLTFDNSNSDFIFQNSTKSLNQL